MTYMGLDLGTKTIGVSLSDSRGVLARPYGVLRHNNNPKSCLMDLIGIIEENQVEEIILGFPKNMNNTVGPRGEASLSFKKLLEDKIKLPVILSDERLSTVEAEHTLISGNVRRNKRKKVIDSVAATIILQEYLDKKEK